MRSLEVSLHSSPAVCLLLQAHSARTAAPITKCAIACEGHTDQMRSGLILTL